MLPIVVPPGNKTVLVEDFTGVSCPNCPDGARLIEDLRATYPGKIISIANYTNGFDTREPESKYQFKTEKGQQMQDYIGTLIGKPSATINRIPNPAENSPFFLLPFTWTDPVINELQRASEVNLNLDFNFDASSRRIEGTLTMIPVAEIADRLNYTIVITESHIIDPQDDNSVIILDYEHNHVLRATLTAPEGDLMGSGFEKGGIYSQNFNFTIPPENGWWVADHCEIIAFVHLTEGSERRVLQAISAYVVE